MTLTSQAAAASLAEIARTERRLRQAIVYGRASDFLLLWGGLVAAANLITQFAPAWAGAAWLGTEFAGALGSVAIGLRLRGAGRDLRALWFGLVFLGYAGAWSWLFADVPVRALATFWATLPMFGYALVGLFAGRIFTLCGLLVTALAFAGYLWAGPWFPLWMAAAQGGGLIAGGILLRRVGLR